MTGCMTDYDAECERTISSIHNAPTLWQAFRLALGHISRLYDDFTAVSVDTPGVTDLLELGWFIVQMGPGITIKWSDSMHFVIDYPGEANSHPGPVVVSDTSPLNAILEFKRRYEAMVNNDWDYSDNRFQSVPYLKRAVSDESHG